MELDIKGVLRRLPHRYPMLLIDRVQSMTPGKSITAIKNVSINEPFFNGHFPDYPVMPGVLILEAMAQAAALITMPEESDDSNGQPSVLYYLAGIDEARFRRPVLPGDQLRIEVEAERLSRGLCKFAGRAWVEENMVAHAKLMCALRYQQAEPQTK